MKNFLVLICLVSGFSVFAEPSAEEILLKSSQAEKALKTFSGESTQSKDTSTSLLKVIQRNLANGDYEARMNVTVNGNGLRFNSTYLINNDGFWELLGEEAVKIAANRPDPVLMGMAKAFYADSNYELNSKKIDAQEFFVIRENFSDRRMNEVRAEREKALAGNPAVANLDRMIPAAEIRFISKENFVTYRVQQMNRKNDVISDIHYKNVKLNEPMDESLFVIPKNFTKSDNLSQEEISEKRIEALKNDPEVAAQVVSKRRELLEKKQTEMKFNWFTWSGAALFVGSGVLLFLAKRPSGKSIQGVSRRSAFTLVEVLVVISIIGILASLSLTAVSKSRKKGSQAVCVNNLKQVFTAFSTYLDDHTEIYPAGGSISYYGAQPEDWLWWQESRDYKESPIVKYLGNADKKLLRCPLDSQATAANPIVPFPENPYRFSYALTSYDVKKGMSGGFATLITKERKKYEFSGTSVNNPSKKIMLAEEERLTMDDGRWVPEANAAYNSGNRVEKRHEGRGDVVFADGHVEAVTPEFSADVNNSNPLL